MGVWALSNLWCFSLLILLLSKRKLHNHVYVTLLFFYCYISWALWYLLLFIYTKGLLLCINEIAFLQFWMCANLRISVDHSKLSHVLRCDSVQLLIDSKNVIYTILLDPSERLGCIMPHIYLTHNYKHASSWLVQLLCWFHPDIR